MKLRTKLSLWSASSAILMLVIAFVSWKCFDIFTNSAMDVAHTYDIIMRAENIQEDISQLEYDQELYLIFRNTKMLNIFRDDLKNVSRELDELRQNVWTFSQKEALQEVKIYLMQWSDKSEKTIFGIKPDDKLELTNEMMNRMVEMDPVLTKAKDILESFQVNESQLMNGRKIRAAYLVSIVLAAIVISAFLAVIIHSIISYLISSRIRKSLDTVIIKMKQVADGSADFTQAISPFTNDEVAEFILHFNRFMDKLRIIIREIQGESVVMGTFSDELRVSSTNLANQAVSTSSALDHMTTAMEDLKQVTETNYTETTSNLNKNEENISDFIKNVSFDNNAQRADELANDLKYISENTLEINRKIQKIEDTVKAVSEIAKQSNILSVNASIQANKSGEFGQPFTVIASEIKALADNSGSVIKKAVAELREAQQMSNKMTLSIEKLDKALKDYARKASLYNFNVMEKSQVLKENTQAIQRLSSSRKSQLEGLKLLTDAMENIKGSSSGNAASARRLEEVAQRIDQLVRSLKEQSENFKT